eukprot:UN09242
MKRFPNKYSYIARDFDSQITNKGGQKFYPIKK